jgi:hypothetical protein
MSKLRIEAVYIDPEVYEPMQELFGLGGMLVDARITFENSLINWSPSDHMEGYAVNSVLDGTQQIWTQIYKIRQQLESRSNTTQQISSSLHKLTAALLDQAMELNKTIERLRTELLFPRAEMLDELSVIEYTNGAITAAAQKAIEGIDKVLAGPTEEQPQADYWGEFTGKEKRMTTMRVYAEGVLKMAQDGTLQQSILTAKQLLLDGQFLSRVQSGDLSAIEEVRNAMYAVSSGAADQNLLDIANGVEYYMQQMLKPEGLDPQILNDIYNSAVDLISRAEEAVAAPAAV